MSTETRVIEPFVLVSLYILGYFLIEFRSAFYVIIALHIIIYKT